MDQATLNDLRKNLQIIFVFLLLTMAMVVLAKHEDKTSPVVSDVDVVSISTSVATVVWTTDEPADSDIKYGIAPDTDLSGPGDATLVTEHLISLSGLSENTTYAFCAVSVDADNNKTKDCGHEFTTADPPPIISGLQVVDIDISTATIQWNTNEAATSEVDYGLTSAYGENLIDETLATAHSQVINDLIPSTTYHFRVAATDDLGNTTYSIDDTFQTAEGPPDEIPPDSIGDLSISSVGQTSLILSWTAPYDETGVVLYDINRSDVDISEGNFFNADVIHETVMTVDDVDTQGNKHSYTVISLTLGSVNYFAIKATDSHGNVSLISNVVSAVTLASSGGGGGTSSTKEVVIEKEDVIEEEKEEIKAEEVISRDKIANIRAVGLDKLIMLSWQNPAVEDFVRVRIVRSLYFNLDDPSSGELVYEGNGTTFSDANLLNGKTYHYSIFTFDKESNHPSPVQFSIAPYAERLHYHVLSVSATSTPGQISTLVDDLAFGDQNASVGHIQELLAIDPSLYPEGLITDYFGPLTRSAVLRFQRRNQLTVTGIVDAPTREILLGTTYIHTFEERHEHNNIKSFSYDLYVGMEDENVRDLQEYLIDTGFLREGLVTGYFGSLTKQAVISFQEENSIEPAVGYVGPITRARILENLNGHL